MYVCICITELLIQLEERLAELQDLEVLVLQGWAERRDLYQKELELQQLQRELEQAEHWLNTYENVLTTQDYGVRMLLYTLLITLFFVRDQTAGRFCC